MQKTGAYSEVQRELKDRLTESLWVKARGENSNSDMMDICYRPPNWKKEVCKCKLLEEGKKK